MVYSFQRFKKSHGPDFESYGTVKASRKSTEIKQEPEDGDSSQDASDNRPLARVKEEIHQSKTIDKVTQHQSKTTDKVTQHQSKTTDIIR